MGTARLKAREFTRTRFTPCGDVVGTWLSSSGRQNYFFPSVRSRLSRRPQATKKPGTAGIPPSGPPPGALPEMGIICKTSVTLVKAEILSRRLNVAADAPLLAFAVLARQNALTVEPCER